MNEKKGAAVSKRFFVNGTIELQKDLQHLAIDLDMSAEKLAAVLLKDAIARKKAELESERRGKR